MRPALAAFVLAPLVVACARSPGPRLSGLLLTLDTTVPEALGCYGGPPGLTPSLDRLAREGILFENARAVAPLTLPAHSSLLTGLYPVRHSVRRNGETRLPAEALTLAERARAAGFQTAAFVAAVVLAPEFGLDQGFERYSAPRTPENVEEQLTVSRSADEIVAAALDWLAERDPERPFFLWLHFYDAHFPYAPPRAFLERANGDPYLGEVASMDAAIGRLLEHLERTGLLEHTVIVAAADHGEGRGRHGEDTHGAFVFDSTLHIPLLVRLPGGARAGQRVSAPVSQVDAAALLCTTLALGATDDLDGRDPLASDPARGVYFESYFGTNAFGWSALAGWASARGKYVHSSAPEFFDLGCDAGETHDVLAERSAEVEQARRRMAELCARPRLASATLDAAQVTLQREIEQLGYAGVGAPGEEADPEPLAASTRPSPLRMVAAYAAYMEGRKVYEEGGAREVAADLLERAVAENPENHKAWFTLGLARKELGNFAAAAEAFQRVLSAPGGERIPAELDLAVCLYNLGQPASALAHLEHALADTPGPPGALELLIQLLEENGRSEDAERARLRLTARTRP